MFIGLSDGINRPSLTNSTGPAVRFLRDWSNRALGQARCFVQGTSPWTPELVADKGHVWLDEPMMSCLGISFRAVRRFLRVFVHPVMLNRALLSPRDVSDFLSHSSMTISSHCFWRAAVFRQAVPRIIQAGSVRTFRWRSAGVASRQNRVPLVNAVIDIERPPADVLDGSGSRNTVRASEFSGGPPMAPSSAIGSRRARGSGR